MSRIVKEIEREDPDLTSRLGAFGVATVHEALGGTSVMHSYMRPIYRGARIAGSAVTVQVAPGDNLMMHVAVEYCRPGDILVVAPTSPSDAGFFGDLLAASLQAHGVRGLVIEAGVRDVTSLEEMAFPVWSKTISARGTVKETPGSINFPISCAGVLVHPGDAVVADDDGVVVVPRQQIARVLDASAEREAKEAETRRRLQAGELGVDIYKMRPKLAAKGVV